MRTSARPVAHCAITAALCVVIMLLGALLELGIYAAPLLAGLCFLPIGERFGRRWHICVYMVSAVLCVLFVPNMEENAMFIAIFGWYPILWPILQKLPFLLRWLCKLAIFNIAVITAEWLVLKFLAPELIDSVFMWILLGLGNVTFVVYDILIPKIQILLRQIFRS